MTKHEFCKQIVQMVDHCRTIDSMTEEEIATALEGFIAPLQPKDLIRFAAWGHPEHQTTPDKCW